ncbi:sugar phosphate nucleotidyltransferase [Acidobacteria bacterium AH-259-G07]|nr:sugar phosphate nucleotidyltransferase [Acidobacteria bacterium AH-259-G07]
MKELRGGFELLLLAGGEGKRLQPVLGAKAKVMADVTGLPFLFHLLLHLRKGGVRRVVLALGHFHEQVLAYLASEPPEGLEIVPVIEPTPLGTAGAIRNALVTLQSDPALVMNGDTLVQIPLKSLLTFHQKRKAVITIAAGYTREAGRYGSIEMDRRRQVIRFVEKGGDHSGYVNVGVYVIARAVIEKIPCNRPVSWEREILPQYVGEDLYAYSGKFPFLDIGTPSSYRRAQSFLNEYDH